MNPEIEAFFKEEEEAEAVKEPAPRPTTMRHPLLLVFVILGAAFLFWRSLPPALEFFDADAPGDCGDLTLRPEQRAAQPDLPPLPHKQYCRLQSTVDTLSILATGEEQRSIDPYKRHEGRRYFVKLAGDKVFAVFAGERRDVVNYRDRKSSLVGFQVDEVGRVLDPDVMRGYEGTARTLRLKYSIPDGVPIRLFDTTDDPKKRWPYLLVCGLMLMMIGLASFGLARLGLAAARRRRQAAAQA
ncbi:hypothetical protein KKF91_19110 [Myxococcota bacterium]|nr:hypothetical protein [Myxococcota bacterium]MBU1432655.1 hypothetical protein [Myxococcota bacterium]MBU1897716.1 hypothetical protein [Myxococcota bacterium]